MCFEDFNLDLLPIIVSFYSKPMHFAMLKVVALILLVYFFKLPSYKEQYFTIYFNSYYLISFVLAVLHFLQLKILFFFSN